MFPRLAPSDCAARRLRLSHKMLACLSNRGKTSNRLHVDPGSRIEDAKKRKSLPLQKPNKLMAAILGKEDSKGGENCVMARKGDHRPSDFLQQGPLNRRESLSQK